MFHCNEEKPLPTDGAYLCSYHLGVVGRYFSVMLGTDLYSQSEDESCLGMLQGYVCVEHEVCSRDTTEGNTCFFWWAHDADPAGALRCARDGCVRKSQVNEHGDTSEKIAGVRVVGCVVESAF